MQRTPHTILLVLPVLHAAGIAAAQEADLVLEAQSRLIQTIERITPTSVCIYDSAQRGGGSGVLIDPNGYGLTNFHVVAGMIDKRQGWGGLSDGKLYELDVLGIDPVGDLAMFRLKDDRTFPVAPLGDSDHVRIGDTVIAAGNPFVLSEDYSPSVSVGIVSGTHRYQWGVGGNLIYSDCIQVDAAINPGNSGGALFNADGEIVGINGRISVGARGRLNVGHGYAISVNQVRRFIPALRAGLIARHGNLGAGVSQSDGGPVAFVDLVAGGPADRAGIRRDQRLIKFDGVPVTSRNVYASLLGTYPEDWPIALEVESDGQPQEIVLRLDPVNPRLKKPFAVQREFNLRQVRRLLDGFRRAVFRDALAAMPPNWEWTATRQYQGQAAAPPTTEEYEVTVEGDAPIRMVRRYDDCESGPEIVYDDTTAVKHLTADSDTIDLPVTERMVLSALYVLQRRLLGELTDEQLAEVWHTGADAWIVSEKKDGQDRLGRLPPSPLEVIDFPLDPHTLAKFSFDPQTGRVVRMRVRELVTGEQATIEVSNYNWAAGLVLPHTLDVHIGGTKYRESLADWNIR